MAFSLASSSFQLHVYMVEWRIDDLSGVAGVSHYFLRVLVLAGIIIYDQGQSHAFLFPVLVSAIDSLF